MGKKMNSGGKRINAGRKKSEQTKQMRVPISLEPLFKEIIKLHKNNGESYSFDLVLHLLSDYCDFDIHGRMYQTGSFLTVIEHEKTQRKALDLELIRINDKRECSTVAELHELNKLELKQDRLRDVIELLYS